MRTHLDNQCCGSVHIGGVDPIEICFDFRYSGSCCGGCKKHTEKSSNEGKNKICAGKEQEACQVPASNQAEVSIILWFQLKIGWLFNLSITIMKYRMAETQHKYRGRGETFYSQCIWLLLVLYSLQCFQLLDWWGLQSTLLEVQLGMLTTTSRRHTAKLGFLICFSSHAWRDHFHWSYMKNKKEKLLSKLNAMFWNSQCEMIDWLQESQSGEKG